MAVRKDIVIDQGSDVSITINITGDDDLPTDLTGCSLRSQIRKHPASNTYYSFTCTITNAIAGSASLILGANVTANITGGRYLYDVELVDSSNLVTRIFEGICTVTSEITR